MDVIPQFIAEPGLENLRLSFDMQAVYLLAQDVDLIQFLLPGETDSDLRFPPAGRGIPILPEEGMPHLIANTQIVLSGAAENGFLLQAGFFHRPAGFGIVDIVAGGDPFYGYVGDFENAFRWGFGKEVSLEVIEYGDPDNTGSDLKGHNQVYLRCEAYIGWGILDFDSFGRVDSAESTL
jgi:hypothetical protein